MRSLWRRCPSGRWSVAHEPCAVQGQQGQSLKGFTFFVTSCTRQQHHSMCAQTSPYTQRRVPACSFFSLFLPGPVGARRLVTVICERELRTGRGTRTHGDAHERETRHAGESAAATGQSTTRNTVQRWLWHTARLARARHARLCRCGSHRTRRRAHRISASPVAVS